MHGLFVGRLRFFHLTFGWHNIFRTLTQKLKPEANAKHDIERSLSKVPWLESMWAVRSLDGHC